MVMGCGQRILFGIVGFMLYGALYWLAFSSVYDDMGLIMTFWVLGMLFSGIAYIAGSGSLGGSGPMLFVKALAFPLIGTAILAVGMLAIVLISQNSLEIFAAGILAYVNSLYVFVDSLFTGASLF